VKPSVFRRVRRIHFFSVFFHATRMHHHNRITTATIVPSALSRRAGFAESRRRVSVSARYVPQSIDSARDEHHVFFSSTASAGVR
jgi:hypothetical protein